MRKRSSPPVIFPFEIPVRLFPVLVDVAAIYADSVQDYLRDQLLAALQCDLECNEDVAMKHQFQIGSPGYQPQLCRRADLTPPRRATPKVAPLPGPREPSGRIIAFPAS